MSPFPPLPPFARFLEHLGSLESLVLGVGVGRRFLQDH